MYLIVGLGNPGEKYAGNRHNVGFMLIDLLAEYLGVDVRKAKFKGLYGEAVFEGQKLILLKPQTYMNSSGEAVRAFKEFYKIENENIIVISDDIDIDFGMVRVRKKGSAGGHNGLKSIINHIGGQDFPRIKIAVNKKPDYMDLADFVLSNFTTSEKKVLEKELDLAKEAVFDIVGKDIDSAMNKINPVRID